MKQTSTLKTLRLYDRLSMFFLVTGMGTILLAFAILIIDLYSGKQLFTSRESLFFFFDISIALSLAFLFSYKLLSVASWGQQSFSHAERQRRTQMRFATYGIMASCGFVIFLCILSLNR